MTDEQRMLRLLAEWVGHRYPGGVIPANLDGPRIMDPSAVVRAMLAARSEGKAEGVEAAAKVAEGFPNCGCGRSDCTEDNMANGIASAIRTLDNPNGEK